MKLMMLIGFMIISTNCDLTRHSGDVLKRKRIFIEAHRGVSKGQKNHNTKEAILDSINKTVEAIEIDAWLTRDKQVAIFHDLGEDIYDCKNTSINKAVTKTSKICDLSWSELEECITKEGGNKIPLLEEVMEITKGKIFMNLEIKDTRDEIWDKIQELIEKYEYYDQISISSFHKDFYQKIEEYNTQYNRTIVFGFLIWDILDINIAEIFSNINKPNHQISLNALFVKYNKELVKMAHENGMTVGVWFWNEPTEHKKFFEIGVDVIITDYPILVAEQLEKFKSDENYLEGCKNSVKNDNTDLQNCKKCEKGYELVEIQEENRQLCKLNYEIDPDLYNKNALNIYREKKIVAIKMLYSPFDKYYICQKNGKTIFYFEWRFDLYGYDSKYYNYLTKYILSDKSGYSKLNEKQIKKLNFSRIQIYVDKNLINQNDFLCIDLYDMDYYDTYRVMAAHCYFIYKGEEKSSYYVKFRLFDDNYISFVTYEDTYLINEDSWGKYDTIRFYNDSSPCSFCEKMKDPFLERASCINKIDNCMYCQNENSCIKCNYGFSLFNGQCLPSINFEYNFQYYTPDSGINYYKCSSKISNCEKCSYNDFLFNKFHCSQCSKGLSLNKTFECEKNGLKAFLLGFSRYEYIGSKIIKYCPFISFSGKIYFSQLVIRTIITYFSKVRILQLSEIQYSKCILIDDESTNIKKYNCSIETNGDEIENIEIDKNIEFPDDDLDIPDIEVSQIAIRQMKHLQNIGNEDYFSKKLYLLNNAKTEVDDDERIFNLTGYIEDDDFHYNTINLEISLLNNSEEVKLENISCDSIKINNTIYTLKCSTNKSMTGYLDSGFSNLGDANLIINFLDGEKKNLNFVGISKPTVQNTSSSGLSTGAIVAIVISLVAFVILIIAGLIIFIAIKRKKLLKGTITEKTKSINNVIKK